MTCWLALEAPRMPDNGVTRAQTAVLTMAQTRAEARALFVPYDAKVATDQLSEFPRSKTFRWLLRQPAGRWFGSASLSSAITRLPLGLLIGTWILKRRT